MNTFNDEHSEEIMGNMLAYVDSGKSLAEILELFPHDQKMAEELFSTINLLKNEGELIIPSKESLKHVIEQIPRGVTKMVDRRYSYQKEGEGRSSIPEEGIKQLEYTYISMTTKWKFFFPVGLVAVVMLVIAVTQFTGKQSPIALNGIEQEETAIDDLDSEIKQHTSEEIALEEIDNALEETVNKSGSVVNQAPGAPSGISQDVFGSGAIQAESQKVVFDPGLDTFFSEEANMKEVDAALADF